MRAYTVRVRIPLLASHKTEKKEMIQIHLSAKQAKLIHTAVIAFLTGAAAYWGTGQPLTKATFLGVLTAGISRAIGALLALVPTTNTSA